MRTRAVLAIAIGSIVGVAIVAAAPSAPAAGEAPLPSAGELNALVLRIADSYPRDGTHAYYWPKGSAWAGTTRDLFYLGQRIADGDPEKRAYCCGLTFEVFIRAYEAWCAKKKVEFRIDGLDSAGVLKLRSDWYCAGDERRGPVAALVPRGIGVEIERVEDARPGDFVQLWRENGSGHSVIFIARAGGGIRYWSTQPATKGIGYRTEKYAKLHIARVGRPAAR